MRPQQMLLPLLVGSWIAISPVLAADEERVPEQLGGLKLGMRIDDAKKAYPEIEVTESNKTQSGVPMGFSFAEGKIAGVEIFGMKSCNVSARFLNKQLFQINASGCGELAEIESTLKKNLGAPHNRTERQLEWGDTRRFLNLSLLGGSFSLYDRQRNDAFQKHMLFVALQATNFKQTQTAAASQPTPTPPAP